jgi:cystathionine beta-lyase/cystathionine gamma-synthase
MNRTRLDALRAASLQDLRADFAALAAIGTSARARLARSLVELDHAGPHLQRATRRDVSRALRAEILHYDAQLRSLERLRCEAAGTPSPALLRRLTIQKQVHADQLRARQAVAAALIVATDWHSPSISHAVRSAAGRHTGRVQAYHDEYKRDRHPDAAELESSWLREYVDNPHGHDVRALATSSGMAAFTTILGCLLMEPGPHGPVLVGASTYHECRQLIAHGPLGSGALLVDETETKRLLQAIEEHRPRLIFLDSLCNAAGSAVPDLQRVISHLARSGRLVRLVIDNTMRSATFQPLALAPHTISVELVVFESVTKYAQLGLDRTAAGMIIAPRRLAARLDESREHLGTNLTDLAAHQVPEPNRPLLLERLARLGRNARELAVFLAERYAGRGHAIRVDYPGLPGHPSYPVARTLTFQGGTFGLTPEVDSHELRTQLVKAILYEARRRRVPLVEGTSFGFDTTRVYLTAATPAHEPPFVRIAAGSEHRLGVETLKRVLAAAIEDER